MSETVSAGGHEPQEMLVDGFLQATSNVWTIFVGENFVSDKWNA